MLVLAAAWADVHDLDPTAPGYEPLVERAVGYGGDGCPDVSEYAVHELGALRGTSSGTAEQLVADALDLRHRHPRLWDRVRAGEVRAWQAVHVARACHHLSREAAGLVDLAVFRHLGVLPWARFGRVLAAAVLQADPATAAERAEQARRSRGVWAYPGEDGLKTLVAKAAAGDVVCLLATVNRLADVLAADGDTTSADERRAKALGLLAQPARVLQLLDRPPGRRGPPRPTPAPAERRARTTRRSRRVAGLDLTAPRTCVRLRRTCCRGWCCTSTSPTPRSAAGYGLVRPEHGAPMTPRPAPGVPGRDRLPRPRPTRPRPGRTAPVDAYEIPPRLREACSLPAPGRGVPVRQQPCSRTLDLDHTRPYVPTEPGRATRPDRAAQPRAALPVRTTGPTTHGRWQPNDNPPPTPTCSAHPTATIFTVTNHGTLALGCGDFAADVWRRARQQPAQEQAAA